MMHGDFDPKLYRRNLDFQQQMADAGRKQLEQVMHQLQEQLQINLLQQSHLMQAGDKAGPKTQAAMQQLQMQQQQLISQLQLVQQRILLVIRISASTWGKTNNKVFDCTLYQCSFSIFQFIIFFPIQLNNELFFLELISYILLN